jgi:hypothetical protein
MIFLSLASEVAAAVEIGQETGWDDMRILRTILSNVYGDKRREIVVLWGDALGMQPKEALRKACAAGLIPTVHPPRSLVAGTLPRICRENISE